MQIRQLSDCHFRNQTILVRVDYNVPLVKRKGKLTVGDPRRIRASYATVNKLLAQGNKVVLLTHLGRPTASDYKRFSLQPVLNFLKKDTPWQLEFLADPFAKEAKNFIDAAPQESVILVENLRFGEGEKKNKPAFAKALSKLGDGYVNDAFSASHRPHASIVGIPKFLPACAGEFLRGELKALESILNHPQRPLIVIVGGAKISDKVDSIVNLAKIADAILIGGGVANNFFKAVGLAVQKSYLQDTPADLTKIGLNYVDIAQDIIEDNLGERLLKDGYIPLPKIIYPVDVVAAKTPESKNTQIVDLTSAMKTQAPEDLMYLDIGPKTVRLYKELIAQAKTIFWNGPMGYFEKSVFASGTKSIAKAVTKSSAFTLVGGGDTLAALEEFKCLKGINYLSLAGGATLEFLAGKKLVGLAVLEKKDES